MLSARAERRGSLPAFIFDCDFEEDEGCWEFEVVSWAGFLYTRAPSIWSGALDPIGKCKLPRVYSQLHPPCFLVYLWIISFGEISAFQAFPWEILDILHFCLRFTYEEYCAISGVYFRNRVCRKPWDNQRIPILLLGILVCRMSSSVCSKKAVNPGISKHQFETALCLPSGYAKTRVIIQRVVK